MSEKGTELPSSSTDVVDVQADADDDDPIITLDEVIEEEQEMAENADEVLAGSDDKNCSYDEGFVKRQALYACLTCTKDKVRAGICLACSYSCHADHELVELYTKRNFRCDCGNGKFSRPCKLRPDKDESNARNGYNQNFDGVYCFCAKPYPCEEFYNVDMIQCCVCEDWFHSIHLGPVAPPEQSNSYHLTCFMCLSKHPILLRYYEQLCAKKMNSEDLSDSASAEPKVENNSEAHSIQESVAEDTDHNVNKRKLSDALEAPSVKRSKESEEEVLQKAEGAKPDDEDAPSSSVQVPDDSKTICKLPPSSAITQTVLNAKASAFWVKNWRDELCSCESCVALFEKDGLGFLLDAEDTMDAYVEKGKDKGEGRSEVSSTSQIMKALSTLDRTAQVEAVHAYSEMSSKFKDFLRPFAENNRIVSRADIDSFFATLRESASSRSVDIPHFCR